MPRRARLYCSVIDEVLTFITVCSKHLEIHFVSSLCTYEEVNIRPKGLCILLYLQTLYI